MVLTTKPTNDTMNTPRTDEILETAPHRDCNDNSQEAFEIMLEHARELEDELNEANLRATELVNHLKLYSENVKGTIMSKEERRNELSDSNGSGYLDGLPEPEVACTRRKALSGSFKCRCVKGAWCYAKGGKRPCDAGLLIPTHIQNDHE